jgi:hypothetical protein
LPAQDWLFPVGGPFFGKNMAMDLVVKVGFPADLYIWSRDAAEEAGLSHSAFLRNLCAEERRRRALASLSAELSGGAMPGVTPVWAKDSSIYRDKG